MERRWKKSTLLKEKKQHNNLILTSLRQRMWQAKDEMNCENEIKNVMIWGRFWVRRDAYKNSMNLCQPIPTHYEKHQIHKEMSWAYERVKDEGCEMNYEWHKQLVGSKFQAVKPVARDGLKVSPHFAESDLA